MKKPSFKQKTNNKSPKNGEAKFQAEDKQWMRMNKDIQHALSIHAAVSTAATFDKQSKAATTSYEQRIQVSS